MNDVQHSPKTSLSGLCTRSLLMRDIYEKVGHLARLEDHAVIVGETGAGKKWVARRIHEASGRADKPFNQIYCLDMDNSIYRELSGGMIRAEGDSWMTRFETVNKTEGGTLYLDQFSELPVEHMRHFVRLFVAACQRLDLVDKSRRPRLIISIKQECYSQLIQAQAWQEILEVLEPISITIPPLRERSEDIPLYMDLFLDELKQKHSRWDRLSLSQDLFTECMKYHWPGNVRQLKNAMLQGAVLSYGHIIQQHHMPFSIRWKLPYESSRGKPLRQSENGEGI